jgi:membrane protein insertase Oxa1/YidC/SpoIIIJ
MKTMELYRTLQRHAGVINALVVKLYNGEIEPAAALQAAQTETAEVQEKLEQIENAQL